MNRTELVKTLTQKAEVPVSEGELLTDIFFRKLSSDENRDNISIPGIGDIKISRDEYNSTSFHFGDQGKHSLVITGENSPLQYPRFSLSLGKPVFPVKGRSDTVIRLNPDETLNMIESRAEKICASVLQIPSSVIPEVESAENSDNNLTELLLKDISVSDNFISEEDIEIPEGAPSDFNIPDDLQDGIFDELTDSTLDEINEVLFGQNENTVLEEKTTDSQDESLIAEIENDTLSEKISDRKEAKEYESFADISLDEINVSSFEDFEDPSTDEFTGVETVPDNNIKNEDADLLMNQNIISPEPILRDDSKPDELIISEPITLSDDEVDSSEPYSFDNEVSLTESLIVSDDETKTSEPLIAFNDEIILSEPLIDFSEVISAEQINHDKIQDLITEPEIESEEDQHAEVITELLTEPNKSELSEQEVITSGVTGHETSGAEADDFSEDFKNIIEAARETENVPAENENITEDNESSFSDLVVSSLPEQTDNLIDNNDNRAQENFPEVSPPDLSDKTDAADDKKSSGEFQRVKSLTREFFHIPQQEQKLSWEFGESEQIEKAIKAATRAFDEIPPADEKKDGFRPVKSTKTTMEWAPGSFPEPSSGSEDLFEDAVLMEPAEFKEDKEPVIPENKKTASKKESGIKKEPTVNKNIEIETDTFSRRRRNQKKNTSFIIIVGFLALTLLAVIAYYKFFQSKPKDVIVKEPVIIERNDQVPVMVQQPQDQEQIISVPPEGEDEITRISQGVYSRNNLIYIQVSSWQTMSKARREAERFEQMGHKTEIQKSLLGAAVWYRVLVGEFSSPEEAAEFRNQN